MTPYIVSVENKAEFDATIQALLAKGYTRASRGEYRYDSSYNAIYAPGTDPSSMANKTIKVGSKSLIKTNGAEDRPLIPFATFAAVMGIELQPDKTLKLNSSYEATVQYGTKTVKVGCQSFSFEKVKELYDLTQQTA